MQPSNTRPKASALLVVAGAGSGKTLTLAARVAWLVQQGADPQRLLRITFSRQAEPNACAPAAGCANSWAWCCAAATAAATAANHCRAWLTAMGPLPPPGESDGRPPRLRWCGWRHGPPPRRTMPGVPAAAIHTMTEPLHTPRAAWPEDGSDRQQTLRMLGARAHQLRAATRAADHFMARGDEHDTHTGAWLMSCALNLAQDLAEDIDALARSFRDRPDTRLQPLVSALRVRAHQLHAAARAADHYLEQDTPDDRDTGSWLIATAHGLATQLAAEIDDGTGAARRTAANNTAMHETLEPHDAELSRRIAAAVTPVRHGA